VQKSPIFEEHHLFTGPLHELGLYLQELTGIEPDAAGQLVPAKNPKPKPTYDGQKIVATIEKIAEPMLTHVRIFFFFSLFWL